MGCGCLCRQRVDYPQRLHLPPTRSPESATPSVDEPKASDNLSCGDSDNLSHLAKRFVLTFAPISKHDALLVDLAVFADCQSDTGVTADSVAVYPFIVDEQCDATFLSVRLAAYLN